MGKANFDFRLLEVFHSSCSFAPSDDYWGMRSSKSGVHLWVIDGATSIAKQPNQFRSDMSDPAWFSRSLSKEIDRQVRYSAITPAILFNILEKLEVKYLSRCGDHVPVYEYPNAAMTYVHLRQRIGFVEMTQIDFADCFVKAWPIITHIAHSQSTSYPQRPPYEPFKPAQDVLNKLQLRRIDQIEKGLSTSITIRPKSAYTGTITKNRIYKPSYLTVGSDGIARIWEEYNISTISEVEKDVSLRGWLPSIVKLREWERKNLEHGLSIKRCDDATLIHFAVTPHGPEPSSKLSKKAWNGSTYWQPRNWGRL